MSVRLYMDVHVPRAITLRLQLRGVDVLTAREMFDARATSRDWVLICAMFHRQSPPCAG